MNWCSPKGMKPLSSGLTELHPQKFQKEKDILIPWSIKLSFIKISQE